MQVENPLKKAGEVVNIGKVFKFLAAVMLTAGLCFSTVVVWEGYRMYQEAIDEVSLGDKAAAIRGKESFTSYEDLPELYVDAILSVEDKRFFQHPGFDVLATGRAVLNDLHAGSFVEGGSTITQQLAKNLYFSREKELTRKVAEVFVAFDLERSYDKYEILELYVNTIYFGDGYYTVKDASQGYFSKEPSEMTDYESTLLAGIPNAPSKYAPTVSPELARQRQQQVLSRLVKCGHFTEEKAMETLAAGEAV